jgi:ABC-type lipoprotein export system ATPase subunit
MVTHNEELARRANRKVHMVDGHIATDQSERSGRFDRAAASPPT